MVDSTVITGCSKPEGIRGSLRADEVSDKMVPELCSKPEGIRGSLRSEALQGRTEMLEGAQSPKA